MEQDDIESYLLSAKEHLNLALSKTKSLMENDGFAEETAVQWKDFLTYLFGDFGNECSSCLPFLQADEDTHT